MDEVFGEDNFINEIIWKRRGGALNQPNCFGNVVDNILFYAKSPHYQYKQQKSLTDSNTKKYIEERFIYKDGNRLFMKSPLSAPEDRPTLKYEYKGYKAPTTGWLVTKDRLEKWDKEGKLVFPENKEQRISRKIYLDEYEGQPVDCLWDDIYVINPMADERTDYPTQKPEALLQRIIETSTNTGDLVMDCFCGSGTTLAVAQKLGRKWLGCDINIGAIQTTTIRLAQIIDEELKSNGDRLIKEDFKGLLAFKILNVNDYDIFKNEVEAKDIVMDTYGIEPVKRTWFDGQLDNNFIKVMPLNRVLNKLDIKNAIKNISDNLDSFTPKTTSKTGEDIYKEGVVLICSGAELDVEDYIKKENNTGVNLAARNILNDKKNLIFKKKPEAKIETQVSGNKLKVTIKEFYSPILMRKLELENEKLVDKRNEAKVEDFKQIIDSVAIDIDYDGKLFNAEIIDLPDKKEVIKAIYEYTYTNKGKSVIAVKIIDVLGEEYFETFEIKI